MKDEKKRKTKIPIWSNRVLSRDVLFGKEIIVMPLQIKLKDERGRRRITKISNLKSLTRNSSINNLVYPCLTIISILWSFMVFFPWKCFGYLSSRKNPYFEVRTCLLEVK
jgi:hypothetical protein